MYEELAKLASGCLHTGEGLKAEGLAHLFCVLNATEVDPDAIRMSGIGLVVDSTNVDIHAVLHAVIWQDEHCGDCCDALRGVVSVNGQGLRLVCQPPRLASVNVIAEVMDREG